MRKGQRYNIYMNDNIMSQIDNLAENMGISRSSMLAVMASQYINSLDAINTLKNATSLIEEVQRNGNRETKE